MSEDTFRLVRLSIAAQADLDAVSKQFEAAVIRGDEEKSEQLRAEAHAHLDSLLDLKAEAIAVAHSSNLGKLG